MTTKKRYPVHYTTLHSAVKCFRGFVRHITVHNMHCILWFSSATECSVVEQGGAVFGGHGALVGCGGFVMWKHGETGRWGEVGGGGGRGRWGDLGDKELGETGRWGDLERLGETWEPIPSRRTC